MDEDVVLMFITNMAQDAISRYVLGALDFVIKQIHYNTFVINVNCVLKRVKKVQSIIVLQRPEGIKKLDIKQVYSV